MGNPRVRERLSCSGDLERRAVEGLAASQDGPDIAGEFIGNGDSHAVNVSG